MLPGYDARPLIREFARQIARAFRGVPTLLATIGALSRTGGLLTGQMVFAEGASVVAAATTDIWALDGNTRHVTGSTGITSFGTAPQIGAWMKIIFDGTPILTQSANLNLNAAGLNITIEAGDIAMIYADTTTQLDVFVIRASGQSVVAPAATPSVRQAVLNATVDSNGLPNFMSGLTGTTLTIAGSSGTPFIATAANGTANRTGTSTANLTLAGQTVNGTYYDYVDIDSAGVMTLGATTLAPVYQTGGTYSTTNNQFTFNYLGEMVGKVGNGATAAQTYRVFIGEHTVAANVIATVTPYPLMARYIQPWVATLPTVVTAINHNLGIMTNDHWIEAECTTADAGYSVGDQVRLAGGNGTYGGPSAVIIAAKSRNSSAVVPGNSAVWTWTTYNYSTQAVTAGTLTLASWKWRLVAKRENW